MVNSLCTYGHPPLALNIHFWAYKWRKNNSVCLRIKVHTPVEQQAGRTRVSFISTSFQNEFTINSTESASDI